MIIRPSATGTGVGANVIRRYEDVPGDVDTGSLRLLEDAADGIGIRVRDGDRIWDRIWDRVGIRRRGE